MRLLQLCSAALMGAAVLLGAGTAGAAPYVYSELTPPGGLIPLGINRSGTIIGQYYSDYPSFVYSNGTYTALDDPLARADTTYAYGINDAGTIVGSYAVGDVGHGFIYSNGVFTTFDVPGALNSALTGINDAGTLWGGYDNHTFVDKGGVILTDPYIGGIAGINDHGVVAGNYTDSAGVNHGYVYANGVTTTIDAPGGGITTLTGINDAGDVVGNEELGCCTEYSFVDKGGVFTDIVEPKQVLGAFTFAYGVSNSGTIVGSYLGYGLYGPASFGFTASPAGGPEPVPEPMSLLVFGAGLAGVATLRRRRGKPA